MSTSNKDPNVSFLLKNMTNSLFVDDNGDVAQRVGISGGSVTITGPVSIPGLVTVDSTVENPVHTHLSEVGSSGILTTPYLPIGGTVDLSSSSLSALEHISIDNFPSNQTVTISGTPSVNINSIPEVEIKNDSGNPIPTTQAPNSVHYVKYSDSTNTQLDSLNRLRVSTTNQNYWYTPTVDKDGDLRYEEKYSGTGAGSAFIQNLASISITSGSDTNGSFIRASRRRFKMRPGVSVFWTSIVNFLGPNTNVTKRRGMFTGFNGLFFEVNTDLTFVVRRRLLDGTLAEINIPRSTWIYDKLNGSGESGYDLRPTTTTTFNLTGYTSKTSHVISSTETRYSVMFSSSTTAPYTVGTYVNVSGYDSVGYNSVAMVTAKSSNSITLCYFTDPGTFATGTGTLTQTGLHHEYSWWMDFDGSRTAKLRFGVVTKEGPVVCHIVDLSGQLGTQFSNAPALMDRTEIFNAGSVNFSPYMISAGVTINTEASSEVSPGFGVASNNTYVQFTKNANAEHLLLGIGLRAGEPYQRGDLQVQGFTISDIANINQQNSGIFYWRLVLNPTILTNDVVPTNIGKCTRQWAYTANTTWSGGTDLVAGYSTSIQQFDVQTALNFLNLGSNIDYTDADKVVLIVKELVSGTSDARLIAVINFIEDL